MKWRPATYQSTAKAQRVKLERRTKARLATCYYISVPMERGMQMFLAVIRTVDKVYDNVLVQVV